MTLLFSWLLADFISGVVHWWEDRAIVGKSRFKFINGIRFDNEMHHKQPTYLLKYTWWENINTTAPIAWTLAIVLWFVGAPTVLWLAVAFTGVGNLVHRFAHERANVRPRVITWLQRIGLCSSTSHHSGHHYLKGKVVARENSTQRYCVMTSWLNPILDGIGFFRLLEWVLKI